MQEPLQHLSRLHYNSVTWPHGSSYDLIRSCNLHMWVSLEITFLWVPDITQESRRPTMLNLISTSGKALHPYKHYQPMLYGGMTSFVTSRKNMSNCAHSSFPQATHPSQSIACIIGRRSVEDEDIAGLIVCGELPSHHRDPNISMPWRWQGCYMQCVLFDLRTDRSEFIMHVRVAKLRPIRRTCVQVTVTKKQHQCQGSCGWSRLVAVCVSFWFASAFSKIMQLRCWSACRRILSKLTS